MSRNLRSTANVKHAYFADQLHTSLLAKNVPTNPVGLAVALNAHLNATVVKPHTVRKWLLGETLPRSGALLQLANWLNIKPEELISKPRTLANKASIEFDFTDQDVISKYLSMTAKQKTAVRLMIEAILLNCNAK